MKTKKSKNKTSEKNRKIINHGITTQKFNENAKKREKKSNDVVWPTPSSKFLKMARGPKSLATPGLNDSVHLKKKALNYPNFSFRTVTFDGVPFCLQ